MRRRSGGEARWPGRAVGLVVVALALAGGCSSADEDSAANDGATTTEATPPSLAPPGTPIGDSGLEVPEGAHLAGPAFGGGRLEEPGWGALVTVDDDPFTVFDDLSGQLRDLGLPMPGTAASCRWFVELQGGEENPVLVPVADGDPGAPVDSLQCGAAASSGPDQVDGRPNRAGLRFLWGDEATGAIWVDWTAEPSDRVRSADGDASRFPAPTDPETGTPTLPDPASVPSDAVDLLPARDDPEPAVGDLFWAGANCQSGFDRRFEVPPGARFVATQGAGDAHAVLAVDDVERVMDALVAQADGPDGFTVGPDGTATTPTGERVALRSFSVVGGGACELLGSPDGTHVLISGRGD